MWRSALVAWHLSRTVSGGKVLASCKIGSALAAVAGKGPKTHGDGTLTPPQPSKVVIVQTKRM